MADKYTIFDAARLELTKGVNLIEASAGTGKTYAIGMLVLRAVVELHIPIQNILVVTFTKAATEELKSRIRARLAEARDLFSPRQALVLKARQDSDQTLLTWAERVDDIKEAYNLLQLALYDIDQAAIFTIHGFCQRMLVEQALESGQLFDVELLADIADIRREVAEDFWRELIYPLEPLACSLVTGRFSSPESILGSVTAALGTNAPIVPEEKIIGCFEELQVRLKVASEELSDWWAARGEELYHQFIDVLGEGKFKAGFTDNFENWFSSLNSFFKGETLHLPEKIQLLSRVHLRGELNGNKLRGDEKKNSFLEKFTLPDEKIDKLLEIRDGLLLAVRLRLAHQLRNEVKTRLEHSGKMGFDDLIFRLSAALRGEGGKRLRKLIGERFTMALIDEFQDTDSSQYHIFSSLFRSPDHYLYLIGDPKQAIYKFRGADIHSYFLAQRDSDQLLTLEKNYRSHPSLIEEVNRLFGSRKNPFYFEEKILGYRRVKAAKKAEDADLIRKDQSLAGMVYCSLPENPDDKKGRWTSGKAAEMFRDFVVTELGRLLGNESPQLHQDDQSRPLVPNDIAILVRSNRQAEEYRTALSEVGIPAVVGSRLSVYRTEQCRELLLLLMSIAAPGDNGSLKTAMTIPWFGFSGQQLQAIWQDEEMLNSYHSRFQDYNQLWQERGVLAMMSKLLITENVLPILGAGKLAERAISNILHLLELVQEKESGDSLGMGQLLQWLRKNMQGGQGADESELLLESDEDAVRIVTMHSAKGLEYPVVFCPYLWYSSNRLKDEKEQLNCHDDDRQPLVDLGSDRFIERRENAVKEEMAEELRLLYVALTRAKIRCYTAWADVKKSGSVADSFKSGLGYLLFDSTLVDYESQQESFQHLASGHSVKHKVLQLDDASVNYQPVSDVADLAPLGSSARSLHTDWQMSSFSGLSGLSEYEHEHEHRPDVLDVQSEEDKRTIPVPGLPAGPDFGNVIHDLLEDFSFESISRSTDKDRLLEQLKLKCIRLGIEGAATDIEKLLKLVVDTVLFQASGGEAEGRRFSLSMLPDENYLKEMGFYFQIDRLVTDKINGILASEPTVTPLSHKVMRGYLTGFVDLICEHQGSYFIMDYKTNFLGDKMSDYRHDKLVTAMQSHNYGLQYWIYTLVLHRYLKNNLQGYDYRKHFGGVMYLFVRGMVPDIPGSGVYHSLPDYKRLVELDLALQGGADV